MRTRQIPCGHEEFVDDLTPGEDECLFEKLRPFFLCQWIMLIEPVTERAAFLLQFKDSLCVHDRRIHLETIANDTGVIEQSRHILFTILCNFGDIEIVIRLTEVFRLFQDGDPRQARLVDLQDETLKEQAIIFQRKSILVVVITLIEGVFGMRVAVVTIAGHNVLQSEIFLNVYPHTDELRLKATLTACLIKKVNSCIKFYDAILISSLSNYAAVRNLGIV